MSSKGKAGGGVMPTSQAWDLMCKIRNSRTDHKASLDDLIKSREKLDKDYPGLKEGTPEYALFCARYVKVVNEIKKCRAKVVFLANQQDKCIGYAMEGRFFDDDTLAEIEGVIDGDDLPLFQKLVEEVGAVGDDEEVGEPNAAAEAKRGRKPRGGQTEAQAAVAGDTDMDALKKDKDRWSKPLSIVVQDEPLAALNKAGLQTLGNLYWFMRKDGKPMDLGVTREISEALWLFLDDLSDNNLKPPPEGMHVEQPKPAKRGGKAKA